jgi:hypothetical protein
MPVKGKLGYDGPTKSGFVLLNGKNSKNIVKIGVADAGHPGNGSVSVMMDPGGAGNPVTRGRLWVTDQGFGTGRLELRGKNGGLLVRAGVVGGQGEWGQVTVHDATKGGSPAVITLDGSSGVVRARALEVEDVYARRVIVMPPQTGRSEPSAIGPYSVMAQNLYVSNDKNFAVPHPMDPGADIHYGALEGPEAPIFTRGRIRMRNGRGFARLPRHFGLLAKRGSITCSVTARSATSRGVSVDRLTLHRISVRENSRGRGTYVVDYVVFATRKTTRPFRVVRRATPASSPARPEAP